MARSEAGFYQYERMLAVAVVGVVLAVAIPFGLRWRVDAQRKAAVANLRSLHAAMAAYKAANGGFYEARLACLVSPGCIPNRGLPPAALVDASLVSAETRHGYRFRLVPGPPPQSLPPTISRTSVVSYCYTATREEPSPETAQGRRSFAIDDTGRICVDSAPIACALGRLPRACTAHE
jgi:type II secretory pathway pseudopilin PulG